MTLNQFKKNYPKTYQRFKNTGKYVILNKNNIDLKLESFLFEKGYSLLSIWNMDKRKMRPSIVYNETVTGIQKTPIFDEFQLTTRGDCLSIKLTAALKHYEEHL